MKQRIGLFFAGLGTALLGWPLWMYTIQWLDRLPGNATPAPIPAIVSGAALLLPGLIYLAWRFDKHGRKGLAWAALGMVFGVVLPVALFIGLLSLLGPFPRG